MNRSILLSTICSLLLFSTVRLSAQQTSLGEDYSEITGTRISLRIPPGFSQAEDFPGIVRQEYGVAVVTIEIPLPLETVLAGMTAQELGSEGMTLLGSEKVMVSGRDATLFQTDQDESDGVVHKWLVVFGTEKLTVLLDASAPELLVPLLGNTLKECLLTARWDPAKVLDSYAGMGFSLRQSDIFEVRGRRPGGVLLARKDAPPVLSPSEPILVVYPLVTPEVPPIETQAKRALTEGDQFVEFENFVERSLTINGRSSYEIIADAKEATHMIPVRILLVLVRGSDKDMIVEAIVEPASWDRYITEFHALAESLQIRSVNP
jgi:hypothetical protein